MENKTVTVEVWKKKEDDSFFTETVDVPMADFQGGYFYIGRDGLPTLILHGGRTIVLKGDGCGMGSVLYFDESARGGK